MARTMTKSPLKVAHLSLQIARQALPLYSHVYSPKRFTQHQLLTLLVLRQFFNTDYRGIVAIVKDWSDLQKTLKLKTRLPHYSTLCYAQKRLLKAGVFKNLVGRILHLAQACGILPQQPEAAVDATGLETRYTSRYFVRRAGYKRFCRYRWPKLTLVCDTTSYLFAALVVTQGPSNDSPLFPQIMRQAASHITWDRVLADAGFDGEHNHRLCREELGIPSTIIPLNRRRSGRKWPRSPYRRQMKRAFPKEIYNQRWQIEGAISQHKRRFGEAMRAKSHSARIQEGYIRIITHDLMILLLPLQGFQQSIRHSKAFELLHGFLYPSDET